MAPRLHFNPAWLATLWLSACGPQVSEVWLQIDEDASLPCLGASHLRLQINFPGQNPEEMLFDNFGVYFDETTYRCRMAQELRFSALPTGRGLGVQVQLTDSSTAVEGVLAEAFSSAFDVSGDSPIQQVSLSLYRKPGVQQGTLMVLKPIDWGAVGGITKLWFRIIKEGETTSAREYYVFYHPVHRPDPFPLLISNLPVAAETELYMFYLEGWDDNDNMLRSWSAAVLLGGENIFFSFTPRA